MEKNDDFKHVYIFGNKHVGFHGHTYYKDHAQKINKTRKRFDMVKIKNNDYCKENLSVNTEFIEMFDNVLVTANEEEFFIESFTQFTEIDIMHHIDTLISNIKYFRFDDKEKVLIEYLISYLEDYENYIKYDRLVDENDDNDIFDYEKAMQWFIANVLDI